MPPAYTHLVWQRATFNRQTSKSFITVHAGGPPRFHFLLGRRRVGGGLQSMFREERNDAKHQMIFSVQQRRQTCTGAELRCQDDPRLKQQRRSARWCPSLQLKYDMKTIRKESLTRNYNAMPSCPSLLQLGWGKNGQRISTAASHKLQFHQHVN